MKIYFRNNYTYSKSCKSEIKILDFTRTDNSIIIDLKFIEILYDKFLRSTEKTITYTKKIKLNLIEDSFDFKDKSYYQNESFDVITGSLEIFNKKEKIVANSILLGKQLIEKNILIEEL